MEIYSHCSLNLSPSSYKIRFLSSYTDRSSQPDFGKGNYSTMMVSDLVTSLKFINVLTMVTWQLSDALHSFNI